jgi:uncharacterized protein (DUF1697 family)
VLTLSKGLLRYRLGMATTYVALLRGIAPMNPKMKNAELKKVFESLGFENVRSVISSGNLVFESDDRSASRLEDRIEDALLGHLGAPCSTIVRSRRSIEKLIELDVFEGCDDGPDARCNVTFLKRKPKPSAEPPTGKGTEVLTVIDQAVFSVVDTTGATTTNFMTLLEKAYGKEITTRTWKTVLRVSKAFG